MFKQIYSWWDLESVSVSKDIKIDLILCSLVKKLKSLGHDEGDFAIEGFVGTFGSERIGHNTRLGLLSNGIRVTSAQSSKSQSADDLLKKRAREWAEKCPNGVFVLFSSDGGYEDLMREMRKRNLSTVLIYYKGKIGDNLRYYPKPHVNWEHMLARGDASGHKPVIRPVAKNVTEADALGVVARTAGTPVCASITSNVVWSSFDAETSSVVGSKRGIEAMPDEGEVKRTRREDNYGFAN